jgi:transposase InsO family protein
MRFKFIQEYREEFKIKTMCRVLQVSKSGYYAWIRRPVSRRAKTNARLVDEIKFTYTENRKAYGSPRIHVALQKKGIACGHNRVARLMRLNCIIAQRQFRRKHSRATSHGRSLVSNLVNRNFRVSKPNRVWAADITVLWSGSGWLYLAVVMDLYSRRIIGWAMQKRMTDDLTISALKMAVDQRNPKGELVHHSDQGSQYASDSFRQELARHHIAPSMSRKGNCYDNAVVESFFKTLKAEIQKEDRSKTREETRSRIFEYIEVFYNRKRLHSTLGYRSPVEYERINLLKPSVHQIE